MGLDAVWGKNHHYYCPSLVETVNDWHHFVLWHFSGSYIDRSSTSLDFELFGVID